MRVTRKWSSIYTPNCPDVRTDRRTGAARFALLADHGFVERWDGATIGNPEIRVTHEAKIDRVLLSPQ